MKNKYKLFKNFVFRTPLLPITSLDLKFLKSDIFKEALYLASRDLLDATTNEGAKEFEAYPFNLQLSLVKYLLRMSARCTPFGVFAGCGIGNLSDDTLNENILIDGVRSFKTVTRLDMDFVAIVCKAVTDDKKIRDKLLYFPNNTLYQVGSQYRYVDYKYINNKRSYLLSEIDTNEFVIKILNLSEKGILANELIQALTSESEYSIENITAFVYELIDNQILISELYPTVTGEEAIARLLKFLTRADVLETSANLVAFLTQITKMLSDIDDKPIGRPIDQYLEIEKLIKQIGISYNPKYLFQSDMFIENASASINIKMFDSLYEACVVLNKLTPYQSPANLRTFKEVFSKRYENEEVLLTDVLDTDIGIGFANLTPETTGQNVLLEDVFLEGKRSNSELTLNAVEYMLLQKYHDFLKNKDAEIQIKDEDINLFPENYHDLPTTMATIIEIFGIDPLTDQPLIFMNHVGGSSASNLLARFAQGNDSILKFAREIVEKEEEYLQEDQLLAEIVHLPESRTGNILYRPILRSYEIPYLALPGVDEEHTIPISDLTVSVSVKGKLQLRSKSLNKQIIPKLSSAHNFANNSLPIYHFLCLLQYEGIRSNLAFNWGPVLNQETFLPRVRYKNIILSPATWIIEEKEITHLNNFNAPDFKNAFLDFKHKRNLPDKCLICLSDNKLFIDLNDPLLLKLFLNEIKKYKRLKIEEFLYNFNEMLIKDDSGEGYTNQLILCFHKNIHE